MTPSFPLLGDIFVLHNMSMGRWCRAFGKFKMEVSSDDGVGTCFKTGKMSKLKYRSRTESQDLVTNLLSFLESLFYFVEFVSNNTTPAGSKKLTVKALVMAPARLCRQSWPGPGLPCRTRFRDTGFLSSWLWTTLRIDVKSHQIFLIILKIKIEIQIICTLFKIFLFVMLLLENWAHAYRWRGHIYSTWKGTGYMGNHGWLSRKTMG